MQMYRNEEMYMWFHPENAVGKEQHLYHLMSEPAVDRGKQDFGSRSSQVRVVPRETNEMDGRFKRITAFNGCAMPGVRSHE